LADHPMVTNSESDLDLNKLEFGIAVNRDKAAELTIPIEAVRRTLEALLRNCE
jgi:multidrug efflux pump subunit AcrB